MRSAWLNIVRTGLGCGSEQQNARIILRNHEADINAPIGNNVKSNTLGRSAVPNALDERAKVGRRELFDAGDQRSLQVRPERSLGNR